MKRRTFIGTSAAASIGLVACKTANVQQKEQDIGFKLKNNIKHSVCHWCFKDIPLEDFLKTLNILGVTAVDLMGPEKWPLLKKYNIHSAMCNGAEIGLTKGWNNPKYHKTLIKNYTDIIPKVAEAGYTNLICFSGNREGMDDNTGLQNCVNGLQQIMPLAEKHGVVLQMELFNQINHPDYMCDTSAWGIELCKALGSESFKLLYDIYHMQIQEGDIIRSIQDNHQYFGHYHTAGVPGRHEIDESQELYYPAIMKAILATGYKGYVAQEFIPAREGKLDSLKQGFLICDV
ncbi:TIM barrel protein [uncultured Maribacter sp.]|uniref:hydroxypyruvate isomerase family protein n=1 Tax=uncultured Maribacter sp. TaxID=431308 RepID=UPI00260FEBB3|nr:TIM barrel protein [uncultured Maribacter sp.]